MLLGSLKGQVLPEDYAMGIVNSAKPEEISAEKPALNFTIYDLGFAELTFAREIGWWTAGRDMKMFALFARFFTFLSKTGMAPMHFYLVDVEKESGEDEETFLNTSYRTFLICHAGHSMFCSAMPILGPDGNLSKTDFDQEIQTSDMVFTAQYCIKRAIYLSHWEGTPDY